MYASLERSGENDRLNAMIIQVRFDLKNSSTIIRFQGQVPAWV